MEIDKLMHSAVGLGIKLGASYALLAGIFTLLASYLFGHEIGAVTLLISCALIVWRGAFLAGAVKEWIDEKRGGKRDPKDIEATQNSSIVIDWYEGQRK